MKPILYISGPYNAPTVIERQQNIINAKLRMINVIDSGLWLPMCPHTHTEGLELSFPKPEQNDIFLEMDLHMLSMCDALWAVMPQTAPTYSPGVALEIVWAQMADMPVFASFECPCQTKVPQPRQAYTPKRHRKPYVPEFNESVFENPKGDKVPTEYFALTAAASKLEQWIEEGNIPDPASYGGSSLRNFERN